MNNILETIQLSKRFGRTLVLDRMDMSVPEGSIYGLLGSVANSRHKPSSIDSKQLVEEAHFAEMPGRSRMRCSLGIMRMTSIPLSVV